ncbi:Antibiotic biosynthesis monooxygenase [Nakamurella panacisegetis]|uniref:Antibiotic biosynthesis monooxygenase n=1 Tax=Nakamurella panacisegetis TaxID=1090615 RepID=A0A1H0T1S1_9ACTN|nr:antibiotic biosynthesis monooxygenase [Nakamurella panacisegetis]SDP47755.1 Antibiotic biosynthesis monooxygenase [Nakamurella panacisegetis]
MFVLVAHFRVQGSDSVQIPPEAVEPLALLAASPDCLRLHFAHSTESAERFVLVAEFESAASYRRALAPWPIRMTVIPWLSTAEPQNTEVSEVLFAALDGTVVVSEPTVPEPGR